jgi:hypothetical protein
MEICTLDPEPDIAEAEAPLIGTRRHLSMGDRAGPTDANNF